MPEPPAPPLDAVLARPENGPRSIVDMALHIDPSRPPAADTRQRRSYRKRISLTVSAGGVHVPRGDWEAVVCGTKPMFRGYGTLGTNRSAPLFPVGEEFPRPSLIYTSVGGNVTDTRMAVILDYRQEPLGAISIADLRMEGFATIRDFRRYWRGRYTKLGWRHDDVINVITVRPWRDGDDVEQGLWLLRKLYGQWL